MTRCSLGRNLRLHFWPYYRPEIAHPANSGWSDCAFELRHLRLHLANIRLERFASPLSPLADSFASRSAAVSFCSPIHCREAPLLLTAAAPAHCHHGHRTVRIALPLPTAPVHCPHRPVKQTSCSHRPHSNPKIHCHPFASSVDGPRGIFVQRCRFSSLRSWPIFFAPCESSVTMRQASASSRRRSLSGAFGTFFLPRFDSQSSTSGFAARSTANPRGPQKKPSTLTRPPCLSLLVTVPQGTRKMKKCQRTFLPEDARKTPNQRL
jgi:hypothetical protein